MDGTSGSDEPDGMDGVPTLEAARRDIQGKSHHAVYKDGVFGAILMTGRF